MACIVPSFTTYLYDYALMIAGMNNFEFSMLNLVSSLLIILGSLIY